MADPVPALHLWTATLRNGDVLDAYLDADATGAQQLRLRCAAAGLDERRPVRGLLELASLEAAVQRHGTLVRHVSLSLHADVSDGTAQVQVVPQPGDAEEA